MHPIKMQFFAIDRGSNEKHFPFFNRLISLTFAVISLGEIHIWNNTGENTIVSGHKIARLVQSAVRCANVNEIRRFKKENVSHYFVYRLQKTAF